MRQREWVASTFGDCRCARKPLVSYTFPLSTTFKNSYPAFRHSIAQASQRFATVEPIYMKSG